MTTPTPDTPDTPDPITIIRLFKRLGDHPALSVQRATSTQLATLNEGTDYKVLVRCDENDRTAGKPTLDLPMTKTAK